MKQILFMCAMILSFSASANDTQKNNKDTSGYQTMDMKQFDGINAKQGKVGEGVKFSVTCLTEDGRNLETHHPEFSHCMMQKKNKMQK